MDLELYLGIHDQFTKFEKDFALLILEWSMSWVLQWFHC